MSDEIKKQEGAEEINNILFNNNSSDKKPDNLEQYLDSMKQRVPENFDSVYASNNPTLDGIAKNLITESNSAVNMPSVINPATVEKAEEITKMVNAGEASDSTKVLLNDDSSNNNLSPTFVNVSSKSEMEETIKINPEVTKTEIKPDDIAINKDIKVLGPTDDIVTIKETSESIESYEKQIEEDENKKYEEEEKKTEEIVEEVKKKINADLKEKDSNLIEDDLRVQIKAEPETVSKTEAKVEEEKKQIEYLGGDPKDSSTWPFIEKSNIWSKKYTEIKESDLPEKIVGQPLFLNEKNFSEYVIQKNRFNSASMTKVPLPFSGITLYVKSYKNSTLLKVMDELSRWEAQRRYAAYNQDENENFNYLISEAYIKLREIELSSIYKHVEYMYVVNKGAIDKPDEDTFYKMIKYPDLPQLYFAIYHGTNKNKRKKYKVLCKNVVTDTETGQEYFCGHENSVELYDEELLFGIINNNFSKNDFYLMIRDEYPKTRTLGITKAANVEISRFTKTKTNIIQYVPNLLDYKDTMRILLELVKDEDIDFDFDLSLMDIDIPEDEWDMQKYDKVKLLKSYLYTKEINFLWLVNESKAETVYKTVSVNNGQKKEIFDILIDLPFEDMLSLTRGKEIKDMMSLKAIDYYIPEITCEECKQKIQPSRFDVRYNFFTLLSAMRKQRG